MRMQDRLAWLAGEVQAAAEQPGVDIRDLANFASDGLREAITYIDRQDGVIEGQRHAIEAYFKGLGEMAARLPMAPLIIKEPS